MTPSYYSPRRAIGAVLAIAALAAVYMLLGPGHAPRVIDTASAQDGSTSAAPASGRYSVLSRPATSKDDISGWPATAALGRDSGPGVNHTLDFANARLVEQDATRAVAVVPTSTTPCLVAQFVDGSSGATCSPMLMYGNSIGLVPDSVKVVMFTMTDGSATQQAVTDNLWRAPAEASTVTYVLDGQPQNIKLMPMGSLPEGAQISASGAVSGGDN